MLLETALGETNSKREEIRKLISDTVGYDATDLTDDFRLDDKKVL